MNIGIVFQQMLVLFLMMVTGYVCYKGKLVDDHGMRSISAIIVNIMNPVLMISGVLNKKISYSPQVIGQNVFLVAGMFAVLIVISIPIAKLLRVSKADENRYRLMTIFSNLGFMGIPIVSNLYGQEAIILVVLYMLGFNIIVYTYGIYLAAKESGGDYQFSLRKLMNPGMAGCVLAVLVFAVNPRVPAPIESFMSYVGNAVIPLAMMMVGAALAKVDFKSIFTDGKLLLYTGVKMLVIPVICVLFTRGLPLHTESYRVFALMLSMPVASLVAMIDTEYSVEESSLCSREIALSTVVSLITIPLVSIFYL